MTSLRHDVSSAGKSLPIALTLLLALSSAGMADEKTSRDEAPVANSADTAAPGSAARSAEPHSWETGAGKRHFLPALEIVGFELALNQADQHLFQGNSYDVTLTTIRRNLRHSWVVDRDPFEVNQLGHPYQGSIYYGFARSAGLNYWQSLGYTFAGSALWEIAGETTLPSRNDQVASGIGGSFLGEVLFRMSSLLLERAGTSHRFWPEIGAAAISPSNGFNRLFFGSRLDAIFPSNGAASYSRFAVGISAAPQNSPGLSQRSGRTEALVDFSLDYGLPGKPDYSYSRPFDYFTFQATGSSVNVFENVMTRGLLLGTDYAAGKSYRGVWGLFGGYDYLSPQFFRVSSTALSIGTVGQLWLSKSTAVLGTALLGAGYAAVGTVRGTGDADYHYGVAPQSLLALRVIFGGKVSLDLKGREFFVTGLAANRGGHDSITRLDTSLEWRFHKQQAIALRYLWNHRAATFGDRGDLSQTRGTIGIFYTLLGDEQSGAIDWR